MFSNMGSSRESSPEIYYSPAELLEELSFQKALLKSITEDTEDYENTRAEVKAEVQRLEARLQLQKNKDSASAGTSFPPAIISHGSQNTRPYNYPQPSNASFSQGISRSISNTYSTSGFGPSIPPASHSMLSPSKMVLPTRKRSHGEHLGSDYLDESGSKSRRTSPSPRISGANTPLTTWKWENFKDGFYELSDDDALPEEVVQSQKQVEEIIKSEQKDAELARRLQAELSNAVSGGLSGSSASNSTSSNTYNAFDRLLGRSNPSTQASSTTFASSLYNLPSMKLESAPSTFNSMPGSFPDADDDSDIEIISENDFHPNGRNFNPLNYGTYPNASQNHILPWNTSHRNDMATTMQGLHMQGLHTHANIPGYTQNWGPNGAQLPSISAAVGFAPSLQMGGPSSSMHPNMNGFDLNAMRDHYGRMIDGQRAAEIHDYINDPRKTQQEIKELLENIRPDAEIPKENREGTPDGLKYGLYEHQKLALTWLKSMEEGTNKGGILADDMGLGKTISALALILSRPSNDLSRKTTLIIGPVALIRQWEREIKTKIKRTHSLSCFVYHSGKKANFDFLRTHDIVLTTYGTLGAEYKRLIDLQAKVAANPGMDQSIHQSRLPFLGQRSKWYRVILDEAQCIKNKGTKSALGAAHLQAQYRFCLTGTPMMNGVHELYSLIHFLRIKPYNDYRRFNEDFGCLTKGNSRERQLKRAMQKLQAVLKAILLRRTKTSKIDGNPILTLPEKTEEVVHALFNEDEQAYYTSLETKTQVQFNRYLKAGTVGKNYSNILVLLLRLRQAACHPHLIMDFEEAPTEATAEQMINLAQNLHPDVVGRIIAATVPFECPVCYDPIANPSIVVPCGHDTCAQCLVKISANFEQGIANGEEAPLAKCPTCRGPVDLKKIIDYETFKLVHLQDANSRVEELDDNDSDDDSIDESDTESEDEGDRSDGDMRDFIVPDNYVSGEDEEEEEHNTDDLDYKPVAKVKDEKGKGPATTENGLLKKESAGLKNEKTEDDDDDLPDLFSVPKAEHYKENDWDVKPKLKEEKLKTFGKSKSKSKKSRKGKKSKKSKKGKNGKNGKNNGKKDKEEMKYTSLAMLKKEASKSAEGRRRYMRYLRKNWISSAKVDKCMEILRNADPDVKTIIFSQFTTLLDLAEIPIQQEKWGYERYDGSMSADARNNAILSFTDDARCKILLVSLKAGNAGLNLVAASQVIILDPFWNPFIEMQAVDRAHRIGQQNEVKVHRILVKSTVEDRIIELQNRKRKLVEAALDEKASRGLGRLGQEELIYLFGSDGARRETAARPVCQPGAQVGAPVDFDDSDASIENIMINLF